MVSYIRMWLRATNHVSKYRAIWGSSVQIRAARADKARYAKERALEYSLYVCVFVALIYFRVI
jgi:hypothetical protein